MIKIGHRGAPLKFPANTMKSFQRAIELGCDMVECDIRVSSDGVLVLSHDEVVKDVAGNIFEITTSPFNALSRLDLGAGEGVPTLQELVDWAVHRCSVMADMKCDSGGVERKVVEALSKLPSSQKIVPGAEKTSRDVFRKHEPTLPLSFSLNFVDMNEAEFKTILDNLDTKAVTWHHSLLTEPRVRELRLREITVYAWTVDDISVMLQLQQIGVDGIISNRPELFERLK